MASYRFLDREIPLGKPPTAEEGGKLYFCDQATIRSFREQELSDGENAFKNYFKKWPRFYELAVSIVAPVLFSGRSGKQFIEQYAKNGIALNVGSGPTTIHERALNVDVFPFPNVHIVAEADKLPFPDNTFDAVCTEQVLEHVPKPWIVAKELMRVTKPGGHIYTAVPFVFPLHPSPKDYSRWTHDGLRSLFEGAQEIEAGMLNGPVSGILITLAYGLSVLLSFGISPLRKVLLYVFMPILSPFKLLDYLYAKLPGAEIVGASPYLIVRK
jgi:SAM-dependent methyltransferase